MTDDGTRGGWGPWALVAGVGLAGVLGLARELRDRRRDGQTDSKAGGGTPDADTDTDTDAGGGRDQRRER